MTTPFDISGLINMMFQLLPFVFILALLPLIIRLVTGIFKE